MSCQKCLIDPKFHSFAKIGQLHTANLFYTAPAKAKDMNNDGSKFANMQLHIQNDTEGKPWIWIVDCANMNMSHFTEMSFNLKFMKLLSQDATLKEVWIMRPNTWIKTTTGLLKNLNKGNVLNVFNSVKYIDGSNIEIFNTLQKYGLAVNTLSWLISQ